MTTAIDSGHHLWANAWGATEEEAQVTKRLLVRVGIGATAEQRTRALRVVVAAGLASFASAAWFTPIANQEFRQRVYRTVAPESNGRPLSRGDREMTLDDLAVRSPELGSTSRDKGTTRFELEWHKKPALGAGCLALALAGVAIASTLRRTLWRSVASIGAFNLYYALERICEQSADAGRLSPALAMWGPVLVIAALSLAVLAVARRGDDAAFTTG